MRADRCAGCGRWTPGRLAGVPRWPAAVAAAAGLVYPTLRAWWTLGGMVGMQGRPVDVPASLSWGLVAAGSVVAGGAVLLFVGKGPAWLRAVVGPSAVAGGAGLAFLGAAGTWLTVPHLGEGPLELTAGTAMDPWVFLVVYAAWLVAGLGLIVGGWRYWVRRREDCAVCGPQLDARGRVAQSPGVARVSRYSSSISGAKSRST